MRLFILCLSTACASSALASPYCPWAPNNPAVCAGREVCKTNLRSPRCALYCNVNPYDVVCGDAYRPHYGPNPLAPGESPYPWVGPSGYCYQFPSDISCQEGLPWDQQ